MVLTSKRKEYPPVIEKPKNPDRLHMKKEDAAKDSKKWRDLQAKHDAERQALINKEYAKIQEDRGDFSVRTPKTPEAGNPSGTGKASGTTGEKSGTGNREKKSK